MNIEQNDNTEYSKVPNGRRSSSRVVEILSYIIYAVVRARDKGVSFGSHGYYFCIFRSTRLYGLRGRRAVTGGAEGGHSRVPTLPL